MAEEPTQANGTPQQALSPVKRKRLQQCFEHGSKVAAQENYDYATDLFTECVVGDPGNVNYVRSFLDNLRKKYNNNKRGSNLAFLKTAGARASVRRAAGQKDWPAVIKAGVEVLKHNPWDVPTLTAMADACEKMACYEAQLLYLKMALEPNSKDPDVCRLCAIALGARGQYDQAIAMWHRVEQARPGDEEAARYIASLAVEKTISGQTSHVDAELAKKRGGGQSTPSSGATADLSDEERLQREIANNPQEIPLYLQLAELYLTEDRFDRAEQVLAQAFEASDGDVNVRERWEDVQIRRLRHDLLMLERKLKQAPTDELRHQFAERRKELLAKELEVYKARCERYPGNLILRYDLAVRYQLNGHYSEAIAEYQVARNDPRRKGLCMLGLGQCFQRIKQYRLAMGSYEEAIREIPDRDADNKKKALYLACKLAMQLGDYDTAERHATTLAGMDFSYKDVAQLLDTIAKGHRREGKAESPPGHGPEEASY